MKKFIILTLLLLSVFGISFASASGYHSPVGQSQPGTYYQTAIDHPQMVSSSYTKRTLLGSTGGNTDWPDDPTDPGTNNDDDDWPDDPSDPGTYEEEGWPDDPGDPGLTPIGALPFAFLALLAGCYGVVKRRR